MALGRDLGHLRNRDCHHCGFHVDDFRARHFCGLLHTHFLVERPVQKCGAVPGLVHAEYTRARKKSQDDARQKPSARCGPRCSRRQRRPPRVAERASKRSSSLSVRRATRLERGRSAGAPRASRSPVPLAEMAAAAGLVTYRSATDARRGTGAHLSVPATIQSCPIAANVTRGFKEVARLTPQQQKWFDEEWGREDARREKVLRDMGATPRKAPAQRVDSRRPAARRRRSSDRCLWNPQTMATSSRR